MTGRAVGSQEQRVVYAVGDARSEAIAAIAEAELVALDTEFHSENGYLPQLCLVQVCVPGRGVWLLDPIRDPDFDRVADVLCATPWLVHAGRQDIHILATRWGRPPPQVIDVQIAAGLVTTDYPLGYGRLVERWLGSEVDKDMNLSDWTRRPLTEAQIAYAVADVALLPDLWDALSSELRSLGREEAFAACCEEALTRWSEPPSAWRRWEALDARDRLTSDVQAVLWSLFEWREQEGARLDRNPTRVLSDGLAIRLARWQPASLKALGADRRMPRALLRRHGESLIRAIRAANNPRQSPPEVLRPLTQQEAWRRDWLALAATALGASTGCSPTLLVPASLRRAWTLRPPSTTDDIKASLSSWRWELAGEHLNQLWAGERFLVSDGWTAHNEAAVALKNIFPSANFLLTEDRISKK